MSDAIYNGSAGMTLYYYMCRSWPDCCRRGENRSWPSISVESVDSDCWCLNNAIFYAFIMRLTVEEGVFILESYLKMMSYIHYRQRFFEKFGRQAPVKSAIAKMIKKFCKTGSLLDKNCSRQKSVLTSGIVQDIQMAITRSPHKSLRKLSAQTGISLGSAHTAVREMLKFYPYRMQVFYELIPRDNAKRVNYCRWFKNLIHGNIGVLDQVFFIDEAWFHLSGYVNSQNY